MAGTQFIGKERIIEAFNDQGAEVWALFQGRTKRVAASGADQLEKWLDMLFPAGSSAAYQLRIYRDDQEPDEIGPSTDYICAWDFKLHDAYNPMGGGGGHIGKVLERLDKLEKKIDEGGGSDDDFDLNKIVMGWLKDPEQLSTIAGIVRMFTGRGAPAEMPAAMGSVEPGAGMGDEEQKLQRLGNALNALEKADPDIVSHLEKLADIAQKKPKTFDMLIGNLDAF